MVVRMEAVNPPATSRDLEDFGRRNWLPLPAAYVEFLVKSNGGRPVPPAFAIHGFEDNPVGVVQLFFGLQAVLETADVEEVLKLHRSSIPAGILPIACTEGADFVCLDLRNGGGAVIYWDRQGFWGTGVWKESDLYRVAERFSDFLDGLFDNPYA